MHFKALRAENSTFENVIYLKRTLFQNVWGSRVLVPCTSLKTRECIKFFWKATSHWLYMASVYSFTSTFKVALVNDNWTLCNNGLNFKVIKNSFNKHVTVSYDKTDSLSTFVDFSWNKHTTEAPIRLKSKSLSKFERKTVHETRRQTTCLTTDRNKENTHVLEEIRRKDAGKKNTTPTALINRYPMSLACGSFNEVENIANLFQSHINLPTTSKEN